MLAASTHLRGIVIAGVLAALALGLGFVTLGMNQTASRASDTHVVLPLKHRTKTAPAPKAARHVRVDETLSAALAAGLPSPVAHALASRPVVVVQLTSAADPVAQLAAAEAKAGAALAGAAYVQFGIDHDGGPVQTLTRLLGSLPDAPTSLVYARPATLSATFTGFNDKTIVEQAVASALETVPASARKSSASAAAPTWASQADLLCLQADEKLAKDPKQVASVARDLLAGLAGLTPPAGKAAQAKQLQSVLAKAYAMRDAGGPSAVVANKYFAQAQELERKLGATGCAEAAA